jgi:tetratricopeptide (TPR) repeat protein
MRIIIRAALVVAAVFVANGTLSAEPPRPIELDLAAPTSGTKVIEVAVGESFNVVFANFAPGARYRARHELLLSPNSGRPGGALAGTETPMPPPRPRDISGASPDDPCMRLYKAKNDFFAVTDEAAVTAAARALVDSPDIAACSYGAIFRNAIRPPWRLPRTYDLEVGDVLKLTVERLDTTGAVQRSWSFELRPPQPWKHEYPREGDWLVAEIVSDIAEMAAYARGPAQVASVRARVSPAEAAPLAYAVEIEGVPGTKVESLQVRPSIWSPDAYVRFASALLPAPRPGASARASAMSALLELTPEALQQENRRVSALLAKDMRSAAAHEQAALVLGALGLREAAGAFFDLRRTACRITAHLAFAKALRGPAGTRSVDGELADAVLATLIIRQADALAIVAKLEPNASGPLASWCRALRLRNTGDWRELVKRERLSFLERREEYRALLHNVNNTQASKFLDTSAPDATTDWVRLTFEVGADVEAGSRFSDQAVERELEEIRRVSTLVRGASEGKPFDFTTLNETPRRCVRWSEGRAIVDVIDWGTWAAFGQRHLCHILNSVYFHLKRGLGLKEESQTWRDKTAQTFGALELFPLLAIQWHDPKTLTEPTSCNAVVRTIQQTPERITVVWWRTATKQCFKHRAVLPPLAAWSSPHMFEGAPRAMFERWEELTPDDRSIGLPRLVSALRAVAPYDLFLADLEKSSKLRADPATDVAKVLGPLVEYDLRAMRAVAEHYKATTPTEYEKAFEPIVALDPNAYFDLGWYFVYRGLEPQALHAFEAGYAHAPDRVGVSHNLRWLTDYYFDHGRKDEALKIAREMADVYSYDGLFLMGRLQERSGRYDEALTWYERIADRYGNKKPRAAFYIRQERRGNHAYRSQATESVADIFPNGLTPTSVSTLQPRTDGAMQGLVVDEATQAIFQRTGVQKNDVIVAVDGYRVDDADQEICIESWTDDANLSLIVLRDGKYRELKGPYSRRKYGP